MDRFGLIFVLLSVQLVCGQVTFVIEELPEDHDYGQSIFISGDFENWTGGQDDFKLSQNDGKYSITLPPEYCKLLFKFTLGSWSTVETNSDGSATDNRSYNCSNGQSIVDISIKGWTVPGNSEVIKSTAGENVRILSEEFEIPQLDRKRRIWIYLPNDYNLSDSTYPVIYMHDGQNLFDASTAFAGEWNVDEIMDRIAENTGFKAIVVGIDNGAELRINEYVPWAQPQIPQAEGKDYVKFLAETLKPYIDENFRTKRNPLNTALMGSSLGGLITHYAALRYPDVFGKAGVFSPSFWIADEAFDLAKARSKLMHTRMYFLMGDRESEEAVPGMDRMISLMKTSGFPKENIHRKVVEGGEHNEKLWRDAFEDSVLWLFEIEKPVLGNPDRIFESIKQTEYGLDIKVSDGRYEIRFYSPEIVETTFVPEGEQFIEKSHAVVMKPGYPVRDISEDTGSITIHSGGISLLITKKPFQIAYSYKNNIILSEKKGYHKTGYGEAIQLNVSQTEVLYGGGQRALGMNRRGNKLQLYNKAHYGYEYRSPLMNFTMPIVMSSKGYMLHFDNAPIGYLDLDSKMDNTITYETISGRKTYQVIVGDNWFDLLNNYTDLTGKQPMPPRWALGNFSSRFGYHSEEETRRTIQKFKEEEIPVDAVILDIYWFGKDIQGHMGNMEFLRDSFPNPRKMINDFQAQNIKTILITEPFVLTSSKRWQEAVDNKALALDSTGGPGVFDFYFGNSGIIDIYSDSGREWFWNIYKELAELGVAGVWGDLGEPEAHPEFLIHRTGTANEVHNIYGHDWAGLVFEGYRKDFPDQRPFILMRAGYSGSQRYGMIPWSGDVSRSWGGFFPQNEMALQMGMQGMGYFHSDLGGFGGATLDDELYARWLQYGVFLPVFRPHAQEVVPSEPVYRSPKAKALAKKAIELRYKMLPYNYSLAFENSRTGAPLMRPLFFEEEDNQALFTDSSAYLWGEAFLVAPIVKPGVSEKEVYLPGGSQWIDFYSGKVYGGGQSVTVQTEEEYIPAFVRGGSFIPLAESMQSTAEYDFSEIDFHYFFDETVEYSEAMIYDDDGVTFNAFESGKFEMLNLKSSVRNGKVRLIFANNPGTLSEATVFETELLIHNIDREPKSVRSGLKRLRFIYDEADKTLRIPLNWNSEKNYRLKIKTY